MYPGAHAALTPYKQAAVLHGTDQSLSYGELEERSLRLARAFHQAGLRPGDHVAMLTQNDLRCFEVYWAAMRSGLYLTAVNRHLSAEEVAYIVDDCGASVLVVSAGLAELADRIVPLTPAVELRLAFDGPVGAYSSYEELRDSTPATALPRQPRGADMLYSSGTTGRPKGIKPPLPEGEVHEVAESLVHLAKGAWGFGADTVYLSPAPIYHAAPLRTAAAVQALGGTVVLMQRFDAEEALRAVQDHRITHSQWVPTMFVRMLKLPEQVRAAYDVSSMRVAVHAAAPCPVDVKRAMLGWWGPVLHEYYSSTEAAGLTLIGPQEWVDHPGSVGRAAVGTLHVCDEEGEDLPDGTVGTVWFERDRLPFSYHGDPDKTREAQHPKHPTWTTTGDIGYLQDGYLYLTDRASFMIISGGVNIYPQEVESALALHPAVYDVAVIGAPDEEMGQTVKACIQLVPGLEPSDEVRDAISTDLRQRLAHYKCPREIEFVEELPRTPTGKLAKHRLLVGP